MCVDKAVEELIDFPSLVTESEQMGKEWQLVIVACLGGKDGIAPSAEEAVEPLKMMAQMVETGGDLSGYMTFKKDGTPVSFN